MINIPVEIGDTILTGKFKNKQTVIKSIGTDEHGMPTINGKKVVTFRIKKAEKNESIKSITGGNKMAKKKQKLDEGMVMLSSMVPGKKPTLSLRGDREDNFVFKGLPGQFDKDGNKVLDEEGNKIEVKGEQDNSVKVVVKEEQDAKYYKNLLADVEDGLNELVNVGADYGVFQNAKHAKKTLKQAYKLVNSVK
jgi:hypothetical protein